MRRLLRHRRRRSWGPGLTLVWKNKTLRINLRAGGQCGVNNGAGQWLGDSVSRNYWYYLRIRVEKNAVLAEVSLDNRLSETVHVLPRTNFRVTLWPCGSARCGLTARAKTIRTQGRQAPAASRTSARWAASRSRHVNGSAGVHLEEPAPPKVCWSVNS